MIAFKHQHTEYDVNVFIGDPKVTFAVELPTKAELLLNVVPELYVKLGVAFCSPKDQFRKKFGRNFAQANLKTHTLKFFFGTKDDKRTYYHFRTETVRPIKTSPKVQVSVVFSTTENSEHVKLEDCYL